LRIPLSIENPSAEPMAGLSFTCLEISGGDATSGLPLTRQDVRFEPASLSVAPRDFEKLTIFVDVPEGAATGLYRARIGLAAGGYETSFAFRVIPAAPPQQR
jgi:hypothetical protein